MQRRSWGYVIAGMLSVKGPLYTLILAINTILVEQAALAPKGELLQWAGLTALGLLASLALFLNMGSASLLAGKLQRKTA